MRDFSAENRKKQGTFLQKSAVFSPFLRRNPALSDEGERGVDSIAASAGVVANQKGGRPLPGPPLGRPPR